MRPFGIDENEQLRLASARAEELRAAWRTANPVRMEPGHREETARTGALRAAREAAGRAIVRLGQRVLPKQIEPCE